MECGSKDALCELATWLSTNELVGPWLVGVIGRFGQHASGIAGALSQFVRDYGQSIVGLIGVSFGFWRWWRYREHILHKRLAEYLRESDTRLAAGTADLIEIIQRPSPGQQFTDPLFIDDDLRTVLRERNCDKATFALSVAASSDWQLSKAIDSIRRRLSTAEGTILSLNRQLSSAYSIRGAIAASSARGNAREEMNSRALSFFRSALNLPGQEHDILLKELEAHQLRKLGLNDAAEGAYDELMKLAEGLSGRDRNLVGARAKRFMAEIIRHTYPGIARTLMMADAPGQFYPGAVPLISKCEPLGLWERLEKADMHYFTAMCCNRLGFVAIERAQLNESDADYTRILAELSKRDWLRRKQSTRLRSSATKGQQRIADARKGIYDFNFKRSRTPPMYAPPAAMSALRNIVSELP